MDYKGALRLTLPADSHGTSQSPLFITKDKSAQELEKDIRDFIRKELPNAPAISISIAPPNTLASSDPVKLLFQTPEGDAQQPLLRVKPNGTLDLTELGRDEYGSVDVAGIPLKQVAHAVADRLRKVHQNAGMAVQMETSIGVAVDNGVAAPSKADSSEREDRTVQPGDMIVVTFESEAQAANGAYKIDSTKESYVSRQGVIQIEVPQTNDLRSVNYVSIIVKDMTPSDIKEWLQKQYEDRGDDASLIRVGEVKLAPKAELKKARSREVAREAAPYPSGERPLPTNGSLVENWPNGRVKTERIYRDGKVVSAIEFSEDGQTLFEMEENVGKPSKGKLEAKPQEPPKPPTEKERLLAHKKRLEEKLGELQSLRPRGFGGGMGNSEQETRIDEAIRRLAARLSDIILEEADIDAALKDAGVAEDTGGDQAP